MKNPKGYFATLAILGLIVVGGGSALVKTRTDKPVIPSAQTPVVVFYDDFNGDKIDANKWTNCFAGNNCAHDENHELECYTPDNVVVAGSTLKTVARKEDKMCTNGKSYPYTSGLIQSSGKFSFKYGHVEVRAKTPAGTGLWSTVWMLASDFTFPPELDPLEQIGQIKDTNFMGMHYQQDDGSHAFVQQTVSGPDLTADFHTYGMDWQEGSVVYYLDGREVASYHNKYNVPNKPMYLLINLAVGGTAGGAPNAQTPFPSALEVDYIKVTK